MIYLLKRKKHLQFEEAAAHHKSKEVPKAEQLTGIRMHNHQSPCLTFFFFFFLTATFPLYLKKHFWGNLP